MGNNGVKARDEWDGGAGGEAGGRSEVAGG